MDRFRNYCFTLNNYTNEDCEMLGKATFGSPFAKTPGELYKKGDIKPFITYLCYAKEIAPTTGTKHLQGYLEMANAKTISALKKSLKNKSYHFEVSKGSAEDNRNYCMKTIDDEDENERWTEYGSPKQQGERTDLINIKNEIVKGKKVDDICMDNPNLYHQYGRTLSKIEDIVLRKKYRQWMTTCDWYYGPTGVGKSHKAFEHYNPDTHYLWKNDDNGWQDGYTGQETVIINEFRGNIPYGKLLELIDIHPTTIPRRGKEPAPFLAKHVIITSSLHPREIYCNLSKNDSLEQLYRRIKIYTKDKQKDQWQDVSIDVNKEYDTEL